MQRWHRCGSVAPDRYGGWKRSPVTAHAERIVALVIDNPDHFMRTEGPSHEHANSLGRANRSGRRHVPRWMSSEVVKLLRGEGLTEKKSLRLVTAFVTQELQLSGGLDTLRADPHPKIVSERQDGADDGFGMGLHAEALHERSVDLDLVELEPEEVAKACIACAEIIQ